VRSSHSTHTGTHNKNAPFKCAKSGQEISLNQMALIHELLPKSMPKRIKFLTLVLATAHKAGKQTDG